MYHFGTRVFELTRPFSESSKFRFYHSLCPRVFRLANSIFYYSLCPRVFSLELCKIRVLCSVYPRKHFDQIQENTGQTHPIQKNTGKSFKWMQNIGKTGIQEHVWYMYQSSLLWGVECKIRLLYENAHFFWNFLKYTFYVIFGG